VNIEDVLLRNLIRTQDTRAESVSSSCLFGSCNWSNFSSIALRNYISKLAHCSQSTPMLSL